MKTRYSSDEIREIFLDFFEENDHRRIEGSSLLPRDDPTLLFINSGMAPLKPYFTGDKTPPHPDLCNVQPCIRTRDIDDVGDRHHLTFFEMLGSWSIGHYFKERAVELAYELLIKRFGFPVDKVYVSVYAGNPELGLEADHDTARAWEAIGIPKSRIVFLGEDNFWGPAGETGPCGPCTEVFYDTGSEYGPTYEPGGHFDTKKRYIEVWNAGVFMQFDKDAEGRFGKLPFKSVDTGSGLERMALVLQGVDSVYETDLFEGLVGTIRSGLPDSVPVESLRILADHMRASTFILAEGVIPGNAGRSYIPRRLIRKCVSILAMVGVEDFDYERVIDVVVERFGAHHPKLREQRDSIIDVFGQEKQDFQRVIGRGLELVNRLCAVEAPFVVSGREAFDLSSTYGMPIELTRELVAERGGSVDEEGYKVEFRRHQETSRAGSEADAARKGWRPDLLAGIESEFVGYEAIRAETEIVAMILDGSRVDEIGEGTKGAEIITRQTPFYAESGGQVGDVGSIRGAKGTAKVLDTQSVGGLHLHQVEVVSGALRVGDSVEASVDMSVRRPTMANHSATHLLHAALRRTLGEHVRQAGSRVDAERLRFDFEHPKKVSPEELRTIELMVNDMIRENSRRDTVVTSYDDAVSRGAIAFFGETYGERVRMVRFGASSVELCGGTHVDATGDIGLFRLVSESSISSGVRRVLAITGKAAIQYTLEREQILWETSKQLNVAPAAVPERVAKLLERATAKRQEAAPAPRVEAGANRQETSKGLPYVVARMDGDTVLLRDEATRVADDIKGVTVLAGEDEGKVRVTVAVAKEVTAKVDAGKLLRALLPLVEGKGGGRARLAQGGGAKLDGIDALLSSVPEQLQQLGG